MRNMLVIAGQCVRLPIVGSPRDNPEITIKTALKGPTVFRSRPGRYVGRYATSRSCRSDSPRGLRASAMVTQRLFRSPRYPSKPSSDHHVANPCLMRVKPSQHRSPRRTATGGVIELRESQSTASQPVQIWTVDLSAVTTEVRIAHIIVQN